MYNYTISPRAFRKIRSFYINVAKKYQNTYSYEDLERNVHDALFSIYSIEKSLPRRKPILKRWEAYHMANTDRWYYAYVIEDDTIVVIDACHALNMHE